MRIHLSVMTPAEFIAHSQNNPLTERGGGWADVWKRDCFGKENKKPHRDLQKSLAQLREYAGNPPLLTVCDRERIKIRTSIAHPHFTRMSLGRFYC